MKKTSILVDFTLLKTNSMFRNIFIARIMSVFALGMLTVAVPVQIHSMTGSTLQVGVIMALDGIGLFIGALAGGVLSDRFDRRTLILIGRSLSAIGFVALALNSLAPSPSIAILYIFSVWGGFFGSIGMTALMAAMPALVGRENIAAAGALSMSTVRLGTVVAPALGGLIIALGDIAWNYGAAAVGTFCTLIPLARLPSLQPKTHAPESPLKSLTAGFGFTFEQKIIGSTFIIGLMDSFSKGIRVLFPALVTTVYGGGAFEIGLMYSCVPLGAALGAFTSGWVGKAGKPGMVMTFSGALAFGVIALMGVVDHYGLALMILVLYGYLGSVCALLQYTLIQGHTPDNMLGRTNSLWHAQNMAGDSIGAFGAGLLGKFLTPAIAICTFGGSMLAFGLIAIFGLTTLRHAAIADTGLRH